MTLLLALACGEQAPAADTPVDADGDRWFAEEDCDDANEGVHPGAAELCDGVDQDCDDEVDEGATVVRYGDKDGDGHGAGDAVMVCPTDPGYATEGDDCDDTRAQVAPGAVESCDGLDDDCDGETDEPDAVDAASWYADADSDGFGDARVSVTACEVPAGFVEDASDCDDADAEKSPAAVELCDGIDNDCDGDPDEEAAADALPWYADVDGDGFGDPLATSMACRAPSGFVADATDCDDRAVTRFPGAPERCDGADDDCDGEVDEADAVDPATWYADADADGYGDAITSLVTCDAPPGFVADASDCDDARADIHAGATEECDEADVDEDCDGAADDADASVAAAGMAEYHADADGDGYGDPSSAITRCDAPSAYVTDGTDCDDTDALVYPGATEYCDEADQDCDGDTWDAGTCSEVQNLLAIADGTWEGDTSTYGTIFWPTFVGDQDGDGTDDLVLTASKESDVLPGEDFGGMYYVPGGQTLRRGMTKTELSTIAWEGDYFHDSLFYAWDGGDVDGDGNRDLWLGTSAYDGMAALLLGPATDWGTGGAAQTVADVAWFGEASRDGFPYGNAATADDLDGDGFDDAAFVSTNSGEPDRTTDAATFVIFGRADVADDPSRFPSDEVRIDGELMSNVKAGDLDGDGTKDLLLNGDRVIYVVDGTLLRDTTQADVTDLSFARVVPDTSVRGGNLQYYFDVVGDWTGDGIDDWAVADEDRPGSGEGMVYVVGGGQDALTSGETVVEDAAHGSFVGPGTWPETIGHTLSSVPDLDGDGILEIKTCWLVTDGSDWDYRSLIALSSEGVHGTESSFPDRALRLQGGSFGELAAYQISAGDFDGDGLTDLGAGSSQWNSQSGRSYVLLGGQVPWNDAAAW